MDIGIAIATMKVARLIDSSTELKQEQLTQAQLQNENMRLRNQIARNVPYYTLNDVTDENRRQYPHFTDVEWQQQCDAHNKANGWG